MKKYEPLFLTLNLGFMAIYTTRAHIFNFFFIFFIFRPGSDKRSLWYIPKKRAETTENVFIDIQRPESLFFQGFFSASLDEYNIYLIHEELM